MLAALARFLCCLCLGAAQVASEQGWQGAAENSTVAAAGDEGLHHVTSQMRVCNAIRPLLSIWFSCCLLTSTGLLVVVVVGIKNVGAISAVPHLAGLRYNLFASLWAQCLLNVLQAFREDSGDGCFIPERYLMVSTIPMQNGPTRAEPVPKAISELAFYFDSMISGYLVLMLLLAMPRKRLQFCPESLAVTKTALTKYSAGPATFILLILNPLVSVLTVQQDLCLSLVLEFILFVSGLFLAWFAGQEERRSLVRLFEHLYLQEWSVIVAAIFTRGGKLVIAIWFEEATARFLLAFVASISASAVLVHLLASAAPWMDPLFWLAGQDWTLAVSTELECLPDQHSRDTVLRFILSIFNITHTLGLVLMHELEWCQFQNPLRCSEVRGLLSWEHGAREAAIGRKACLEWARWAEKVCSSWPGLNERRTCMELQNVVPPTALTPQERELMTSGQLTWRSPWMHVWGDLFSDRVHSQEIPVICTVWILSNPASWSMLTTDHGLIKWDETASVLFQSILFCVGLWLVLSILLMGNNVFLPLCLPGENGRRFWLATVCLLTSGLGLFSLLDGWAPMLPSRVNMPNSLRVCWGFMHFTLSVGLLSISMRQICMSHAPQVRNTFHRLEFASQRYCQKLLEGELSSNARSDMNSHNVAPNQIFQVRCGSGWFPCRVTSTSEDGTCSVVLQGGQPLASVLLKDLAPLHIKAKRHEDQRDADAEEVMDALAPALDAFNSEGNEEEEDDGEESFSNFQRFRSGLLAGMSVKRFEETMVNEAIITAACDRGKTRAQHLKRQRMQAQGFRAFFNSSVGVSGLMLTAILIGPMLVIICSTYLAMRTGELEQGIRRLRSRAFYAMRVQTQGFQYGACAPASAWELEACMSSAGAEACGPAGTLLLWSFDEDESNSLHGEELDDMASVLSGVSLTAVTSGREELNVSAKEVRSLAQAAAASSHSGLDVEGLGNFACMLSRRMRRGDDPIIDGNLSASALFAMADRSPRDGYLTEEEVMDLGPGARLGALDDVGVASSLAVHVGFSLGDVSPIDGRLSRPEFDVAMGYIRRLEKNMPKLAAEIAAVQSGTKLRFDSRQLLDALDLDGDGDLSRAEAGIISSVLETMPRLAHLASLVLPVFDSVDRDDTGLLQEEAVQRLLSRLGGMLVLAETVAQKGRLDQETLVSVLDLNDDEVITRREFDSLAGLIPPPSSSQAGMLGTLVFMQTDVAPRDGRLAGAELQAATESVQALARRFPAPAAGDRRLALQSRKEVARNTGESVTRALLPLLQLGVSTIYEGKRPLVDAFVQQFLRLFTCQEFAVIMPIVILGLRLSILGGAASAVYLMVRTKNEHERLTQRMQMGDHGYLGGGQKHLLRNSFSVSTSFPGLFIATLVINFLVASAISLVCLTCVVTPIVLFILPASRASMVQILLILRFPMIASLLKYLLKVMVVDKLLVEHGQPIYPYFFSPLWFSLIVINFVQAPFFAVFRWCFLVIHATVKATFLHETPFSDEWMSWDPGYYAFLSLTFTQSARRNLVRTCFISALMPQMQRARGQEHSPLGPEAQELRRRRLRMRNRLWVAVTLWNNPELREERRQSREREVGALTALWDAENAGKDVQEDSLRFADRFTERFPGSPEKTPRAGQREAGGCPPKSRLGGAVRALAGRLAGSQWDESQSNFSRISPNGPEQQLGRAGFCACWP